MMKKLFLAMSVLALVAFMAGPSSALVGMPDDVPGNNVLVPFFLVSIPTPGGPANNTHVIITEVSGLGGVAGAGYPWIIYDKKSTHVADGVIKITQNDVVPIDMSAVLANLVGAGGLARLEVDLDGDGVPDHWMGYMTITNPTFPTRNNLIAHLLLIDLLNGQSAATTIPAREYAPRPIAGVDPFGCVANNYRASQNTYFKLQWLPPIGQMPFPVFTDYEVFTAFALRESRNRAQLTCVPWTVAPATWEVPQWFRLMPRYYLHDALTADNYIFIWTSGNWGSWDQGGMFDPDTNWKVINIYDEAENRLSGQINIPYELNVVDVRQILPAAWLAGRIGGWLDIRWDYTFFNAPNQVPNLPWVYDGVPMLAEWLAYSWQTVSGAVPGLNWSVLYAAHRTVGPYINPLGLIVDPITGLPVPSLNNPVD